MGDFLGLRLLLSERVTQAWMSARVAYVCCACVRRSKRATALQGLQPSFQFQTVVAADVTKTDQQTTHPPHNRQKRFVGVRHRDKRASIPQQPSCRGDGTTCCTTSASSWRAPAPVRVALCLVDCRPGFNRMDSLSIEEASRWDLDRRPACTARRKHDSPSSTKLTKRPPTPVHKHKQTAVGVYWSLLQLQRKYWRYRVSPLRPFGCMLALLSLLLLLAPLMTQGASGWTPPPSNPP